MIVGLAPGLQGANRTGRPFTGDYAGDLLYSTLLEFGFAKGTYQAQPDDGLTLVDPGPTSCLATLESGLAARGHRLRDVSTILLTHIHLVHAGATGTIVERVPHVKVYVHERGAPHMIDPTKLLASSTRLHGDQMDRLWGAFVAVPAPNMTVLSGGERLEIGGTPVRVAYTPGHAKHHVSFLDEHTGVAYVGDTGGVRVSGEYIIAPTPPPDIDVEAWEQSLDTIAAWEPAGLALTHFGTADDVPAQLGAVRESLRWQADLAAEDDQEAFMAALHERISHAAPHDVAEFEQAAPLDHLFLGLHRWHSKQR